MVTEIPSRRYVGTSTDIVVSRSYPLTKLRTFTPARNSKANYGQRQNDCPENITPSCSTVGQELNTGYWPINFIFPRGLRTWLFQIMKVTLQYFPILRSLISLSAEAVSGCALQPAVAGLRITIRNLKTPSALVRWVEEF